MNHGFKFKISAANVCYNIITMACSEQDSLKIVISEIASLSDLEDWNYTQRNFESVAQNYFGIIIPAKLTGKKDGIDVNFDLLLKLAPTDERFRVSGAVTLMFAREIYVYCTVLKHYEQIQKIFSPVLKYIIPKCYYVNPVYCKEVIAMHDMQALGYRPYEYGMFLDLDHIIISLKSLAKFHALSFITQVKDPKLHNEFTKVCIPLNFSTNQRFFEIMTDRLTKAMQKFENTCYVSLFEHLKLNCSRYFITAVEKVQATCICHGDIWKENILFKYENNKPVSACLIDYQTTRIISPAFDTLYLIISSTDTELREKYFNDMKNSYYQTFEQVLNEAGVDYKVYSRQTFENDLKVVGPACLITANTALWLLNGLQEEGHVRSKHIWTSSEDKEQAVERFRSIIKGIIDDLSKYGYLCTGNLMNML